LGRASELQRFTGLSLCSGTPIYAAFGSDGGVRNPDVQDGLKRNSHHYGRILGDHDLVDPEKGIHVLLDADMSRVGELSPFAFSQLLAHQAQKKSQL
jgi:hypothetical protein